MGQSFTAAGRGQLVPLDGDGLIHHRGVRPLSGNTDQRLSECRDAGLVPGADGTDGRNRIRDPARPEQAAGNAALKRVTGGAAR